MPKSNRNNYLYASARALLHRSRWLVPASLVQATKKIDQEFASGITTHIERYDHRFKPLYRAISRCFPAVKLTLVVHGHGYSDGQCSNLERLPQELCSSAPAHHSFVLHDRAVGLTTMWNEVLDLILPLSSLIFNDELRIFARAGLAGIPVANVLCPSIAHQNHQPRCTSVNVDSGRLWGKYTSINQACFFSMWQTCPEHEGVFVKQMPAHVNPSHSLGAVPLPRIARSATAGATRIFPGRPLPSAGA